jgi:hypothetical protein
MQNKKISEKTKKEVEKLADEARNSLSNYCHEECHAYCCRKGYLVLEPFQVDTVTQGKKDEMIKKGSLKKLENGKYSMYMGHYEAPCPSLNENFQCKIHKSDKRNKACADFPVFLGEGLIKLSPRCPAVKAQMLYPYEKQILMRGYKLVKPHPFADMDSFNCDKMFEVEHEKKKQEKAKKTDSS